MLTLRKCSEYYELNKEKREKVRLACIGDSITGWNNQHDIEKWIHSVYPSFLEEKLSIGDIANCGVGGEVSNNLNSLLRKTSMTFPNARLYIVGIGTNDLGTSEDISKASDNIIMNLSKGYSYMRENNIETIMFNVPPVRSAFFSSLDENAASKREYHNSQLKQFCESNNIPLVDVYSCMTADHLSTDRLHPNVEGAELIASKVYEVVLTSGFLK